MEFVNPQQVTTKESAARMFGSQIMRCLTYVNKTLNNSARGSMRNNRDAQQCFEYFDNLTRKFRTVYDGIMSPEQIIEKVGPSLMNLRAPIIEHNADFFINGDLAGIFASVSSDMAGPDAHDHLMRKQIAQMLDSNSRTIILDALNIMLILYSKYLIMRK